MFLVDGVAGSRPDVTLFMRDFFYGGAERSTVALANAFAGQGLSVDVVTLWAHGVLKTELDAGIRVFELRQRSAFRSLRRLVRYMRQERPRAFIAGTSAFNLVAVWAHRLANRPGRMVVVERNTLSLRSRGNWRKRVKHTVMGLTYPLADHVVTISQGVANDLARTIGLDRSKITVIYNAFDVAGIQAKAHELVDHPWFLEQDKPVVVAVGRMTVEKDFECLIRAFAELRKSVDARLFLVGDGPERPQLERLSETLDLRDHLVFAGLDPNPFRYMARADLFVLSSRVEGFSRVLVEAIACGVPVVSTDCPSGPREVLDGGRYGDLVPVGDAAALAEAMRRQLGDAEENCRDRIEAGKRRAAFFSPQAATSAFGALLFDDSDRKPVDKRC